MINKAALVLSLVCLAGRSYSQAWVPDNGDGTYKNPVIYADYSDPDVIRAGDTYYMIASSFTCQPGIPVLSSKDLVNWTIINYVYDRLPLPRYEAVQHGQGSWAPSIRYHKGRFFVFFCTPEDGLFMAESTDPAKKWELHLVQQVQGWEDPCPFWDDNGEAYLLHGQLGGGPAILHRMSPDGKALLDGGKLIFQDDKRQPVLEGFKFMDKREGYYYFTAPAGGVSTGWQSVFRSKNIYGPYEDRIVLAQGKTEINGPHQGGLVQTQTGEWWFLHFQDKGAYGRITHLQPVEWKDGWPVMGRDEDGDGTGEPVNGGKKPSVGKKYAIQLPQTSDEFNNRQLGLQWQWQAAPQNEWYSLSARKGWLRLTASSNDGVLRAPNALLQKFPAPAFTATTRLTFRPASAGERAGLIVMGSYYTWLCLEKQAEGYRLVLYEGENKEGKEKMKMLASVPVVAGTMWLRATVDAKAMVSYSYSSDGKSFITVGKPLRSMQGTWIGAKAGLLCTSPAINTVHGHADFDFFKITK
ncbi:glycosyl hydrolase 43 family protein [Arcticibacter tournemirensis]|uniref:Glycosyl hydrolase 43 family protein n=2 Tax=Arcticibacter tournemirensis TaxID=699437 RepID=A0A4Q0MAX4_9SPHI|nr:glycosyl hydrolase 43 family protein [Arcticibacter tournemirensis]